jgi:hypothetical protein
MAEVVICCADEDLPIAGRLGEAVTRAGYSVWLNDAPSSDFWNSDEVIERIGEAEAVIALWSRAAAASALFRSEAEAARAQRKLILSAIEARTPPIPFDGAQIILLDSWHGGNAHPGMRRILDAIEKACGPRIADDDPPPHKWHRPVVLAAALSGAAILAAATLPWGDRSAPEPAPVELAAAEADLPPIPAVTTPRVAAPAPPPVAAPEPVRPVELALKTELPVRAVEARQPERPRSVSLAKPAVKSAKAKPAKKPTRPRIKYRYSENMRLFCERAGKGTPQCRTFRRNVRSGALLPKEQPRPRSAFPA